MRTSLFFLLLISTRTYAHIEANSAVRHYDDVKTQVTSPHLEVKASFLGDRATVGAGYSMDIVTSASSDVNSFASKTIHDTRREISSNLGWLADGGSYSWSFINSQENDYASNTYAIGATKDFFEKNTVVGIGMAYGDDKITSSANSNFKQFMTNETFSLSLTQVLTRVSVVQFLYDLRVENGYTASPYRKARIKRADGTISGIPENHPRTRNRHSFATKYNYYWKPFATSTSFRFYTDSWQVMSYTGEERITYDFSKSTSLALNLRYYHQSQANFYRDTYDDDPGPFYTGNKTLATYDSYQIGLRPLFALADDIKLFVKGEYYTQKFANHTDVGKINDPSDDKKLEIHAYILGAGLECKF